MNQKDMNPIFKLNETIRKEMLQNLKIDDREIIRPHSKQENDLLQVFLIFKDWNIIVCYIECP